MEEIKKVKTMEPTDKKCEACGGTMDFDPNTSGLLCPYCGAVKDIKTEELLAASETDLDKAEETGNFDWGAEKKTVVCKSCGAHSVYDELQISDECPYCGSNQVMEEKGEKALAPGGVCVFKIDKKQAGDQFRNWIKKKLFCPKKAKQKATPDSFTGVYLPYWTFDTETASEYSARYGINRQVRDKDGTTRTVTDWHHTQGYYREFINDYLILATNRHKEALLKRIEPFDTEKNLVYKPEYVAGFVSERYSIGLKDSWEKAKTLIKNLLANHITSKIKSEKRADAVANLKVKTTFSQVKYKYLLLPVWISSFKYNGKIFQFMVNGQTGKVGGKTPVSAIRVIIAILLGLLVAAVVYYLAR